MAKSCEYEIKRLILRCKEKLRQITIRILFRCENIQKEAPRRGTLFLLWGNVMMDGGRGGSEGVFEGEEEFEGAEAEGVVVDVGVFDVGVAVGAGISEVAGRKLDFK